MLRVGPWRAGLAQDIEAGGWTHGRRHEESHGRGADEAQRRGDGETDGDGPKCDLIKSSVMSDNV